MSDKREFLWKCKGGMVKLIGGDICYLHTEQKKTFIHTVKRVYEIPSSLRQEEVKLQELPVVRVHQGYLVHLGGMESLIKNEVMMRNGDVIPVSESRKKHVQEQIILYINREGKYKKIR